MKQTVILICVVLAFGQLKTQADAQEVSFSELAEVEDGCEGGCLDWHNCGHGPFMDCELLSFKYHRADGARTGVEPGESVLREYLAAPRMTLGWISPSGPGARFRWFQFDHSLSTQNGFGFEFLHVETYTIDFEVFERIKLSDNWFVELSGGARYNEFTEVLFENDAGPDVYRINKFAGWGGMVGIELSRSLGHRSRFYVRSRGAIMMGDKFVSNYVFAPSPGDSHTLIDSTTSNTTVAFGYEYNRQLKNRSLLTVRVGWELQNWSNYSSAFQHNNDQIFVGPADVGFNGLAFMVRWKR